MQSSLLVDDDLPDGDNLAAAAARRSTPGHWDELRAAPGGVLERRGHTEGAVELARLAGLQPAAVLCELMNEDGSMMKGEELVAFSRRHGYPMLTIDELVSFRRDSESVTA